jgi:hypothetical protein
MQFRGVQQAGSAFHDVRQNLVVLIDRKREQFMTQGE